MGNDESKGIADRRTYLNTSPSALACVIKPPHRTTIESSTGSRLNIQEEFDSPRPCNNRNTNSKSTSAGCSKRAIPLIVPKSYGEKLIFDDDDVETKTVQVFFKNGDESENAINSDDDHTSLVERGSSCTPLARKLIKAEQLSTKTFFDRDDTPLKEAYRRFNENSDKVIDNSFIETTMAHTTGIGKGNIGVDSLNTSSHTTVDTGFSFPSYTVVSTDFNSSHPAGVKLLNLPSNTEVEPILSSQAFDKMIASKHTPDSGICWDDRETRRCNPMLGSRPDYSRFVSSDTDLELSLNFSASGSLLSNRLFTLEDIQCIDDEGLSSETESIDENAEQNEGEHNDFCYAKQYYHLLNGSTNIGKHSSPPMSDIYTNLDTSSFPPISRSCRGDLSGRARAGELRRTDRRLGKERQSQASDLRFCESLPDGAVGGRDDGDQCGCSDEAAAPSSYPCGTTRDRTSRGGHCSSSGTGADAMENNCYHGGPAEGDDGGGPSSYEQLSNRRRRMKFDNPCRSINVKTYYLAYLACPADDLSFFGLSFHEMLESWGQHICIPERDLPANDAKYNVMAEWLQEFCRGKVIVVVSKNYANSDECLFITYFAKTLDPDAQRSSIIPVVIDKNVEIPAILSGLSIINYNFLYKKGWLKSKLIKAIAA